jgi:protein-tyrosine phosphatase
MPAVTEKLPFDRCYWVQPGKLLAGLYPGSQDYPGTKVKLQGLLDVGIRAVIKLMQPHEVNYQSQPFRPYELDLKELAKGRGLEVSVYRFPVRDNTAPKRPTMVAILDCLDQCLAEGRPVYLHCWGGRGRTGTVVGCHLIRHGLADPANALETIAGLRSAGRNMVGDSPETEEQLGLAKSWKFGE